jgi:hypothetical protein
MYLLKGSKLNQMLELIGSLIILVYLLSQVGFIQLLKLILPELCVKDLLRYSLLPFRPQLTLEIVFLLLKE